MTEIQIGEGKKINLERKGDTFIINGESVDANVYKIDEHHYKVFKNNKVYTVELLQKNGNELSLLVNGKTVSVSVIDQIDKILKKLGMRTNSSTSIQEIKSPMPGTILSLSVASGTHVQKGESILILEAMKMENVIKSPRDGVINSVLVKEGDNVEKNQKLISFD